MYTPDSRGIPIRDWITLTQYICLQLLKLHYLSFEGESEGYTVKSKEKDIAICDYPLLQTEFLYASKKGMAEL